LKRLYQSKASEKGNFNSVVNQLQEQIKMLTEISDKYNEKIDDLKMIASKKPDTREDKDEAQEIKQALKSENKELKDKIEWLNKDIEFKT
jgi:DNA-binding transcriptional regulator GbsR (MarR family)